MISADGKGRASPAAPAVIVSANAFWNIANFRRGLIDRLIARGYRTSIACPDADQDWGSANGVDAFDIQMDRSGVNPFHWERRLKRARSISRAAP